MTLDFTEAFGGVHYNNRTITLVFLSLEPWSDQMEQDSSVKNALHGKKMKIVFSDDPDYYWIGRVNVGGWEYYKGAGRVEVTIDAEPFKYLGDETVVFTNLGNNKNVYRYYDDFETITNTTIATRVNPAGSLGIAIISASADVKHGSKALELSLISEESVGGVVLGTGIESKNYGRVSLVPGRYIASLYSKVAASYAEGSTVSATFGVYAYAGLSSDNRKQRREKTVTLTKTWQRIEIPFSIPKDSVFSYAAIRIQLNEAQYDAVFDCFMIERADSASASASEWTEATINAGVNSISLQNRGAKAAVPYVSTSNTVQLSWDGGSVVLPAGNDWQIPQLVIPGGTTLEVQATGSALLSFRYQEASL